MEVYGRTPSELHHAQKPLVPHQLKPCLNLLSGQIPLSAQTSMEDMGPSSARIPEVFREGGSPTLPLLTHFPGAIWGQEPAFGYPT